MPGIQRWREDEIWFILNKKREGATNVQILPHFRRAFPKHFVQNNDPGPVNYVWSHYNYRPEYAPENFEEFLARYNREREAQEIARAQIATLNEQDEVARQDARFTSRADNQPSANQSQSSSMTDHELTQNSRASHTGSVAGTPTPAIFSSPPWSNVLTSSLSPLEAGASTRELRQGKSKEANLENREKYHPLSSFPIHTASQSSATSLSQQNLMNKTTPHPNPFQSTGKIYSTRIGKKPKRPAPTSVLRSNARYTGFRSRRNLSELASEPPPTPAQRYNKSPRVPSLPLEQTQSSPLSPIEVARFEGFRMTFDPNDASGLPYAVFTLDGRRIVDSNDVPERVFKMLSILSSKHPATCQESPADNLDGMHHSRRLPFTNSEGNNMYHQESLYGSDDSKSELYGQQRSSATYSGEVNSCGWGYPSFHHLGHVQDQNPFPKEGPKSGAESCMQNSQLLSGSMLPFSTHREEMHAQGNTSAQLSRNQGNVQEVACPANDSNDYDGSQEFASLGRHAQTLQVQYSNNYTANQNANPPARAANHPSNCPPSFTHSAVIGTSNLHLPSITSQRILRSRVEPNEQLNMTSRTDPGQTPLHGSYSVSTGQHFNTSTVFDTEDSRPFNDGSNPGQQLIQEHSGSISMSTVSQQRVDGSRAPEKQHQDLQAPRFGNDPHQTLNFGFPEDLYFVNTPTGTSTQIDPNLSQPQEYLASTAPIPCLSVENSVFQSNPVPNVCERLDRDEAVSEDISNFFQLSEDDFVNAMTNMEMLRGTILDKSNADPPVNSALAPFMLSQQASVGLGISMNSEARLYVTSNKDRPLTRACEVTGHCFEAESAMHGFDRIINICGATFVAPFIIPSLGTGWALSRSNITPHAASAGPTLGSFSIGNTGTGMIINITNSTFQLGIDFEDLFDTRDSVSSLSVLVPGPQVTDTEFSGSTAQTRVSKDAVSERSKPSELGRPHSRSKIQAIGSETSQLSGTSPRCAKRPAEEPASDVTPAKRTRFHMETNSPTIEGESFTPDMTSSQPVSVAPSPAPNDQEPQAPQFPRRPTSVLEDLALEFELFGSPTPEFDVESEVVEGVNLWVEHPVERERVEQYELQ